MNFDRKTPPPTSISSAGISQRSQLSGNSNGGNLPPRPAATRKSSFMTLTAALSAATASVTGTSTPASNNGGTTPVTELSADSAKNRQEEGYYGDSNDNLSPTALKFLEKLPDLSYLLS